MQECLFCEMDRQDAGIMMRSQSTIEKEDECWFSDLLKCVENRQRTEALMQAVFVGQFFRFA